MSLWNWISNISRYLGLYKKSNELLFFGSNNAGIATLIMLKNDEIVIPEPIRSPMMEKLSIGNLRFITYDLSTHQRPRRVWKEYFSAVDAIVFVVDAWDRSRFYDSLDELNYLLTEDSLSNCPVLILGNKIDKCGAASEDDILDFFGLYQLTTGKVKINSSNAMREINIHQVANFYFYKTSTDTRASPGSY